MVFVVLFISSSAIYRAGLSGSIAKLICFQSSSSAPFLKSKIDVLSAAVPAPLYFSSVGGWGWSIAEAGFTSCCAAYNYRPWFSIRHFSQKKRACSRSLWECCSEWDRKIIFSIIKLSFSMRISCQAAGTICMRQNCISFVQNKISSDQIAECICLKITIDARSCWNCFLE